MSVIFHKKQKDIFLKGLINGTLSHAYIVEGQAGIGKKTFAFFAAKAILCKGNVKPCGKCISCQKAELMQHPDLMFLSASDSGTFKVESVRELIKTVYYLPNESDKKVYILDMAHKMTPSAQNALLKVFEEPPSSAVFFILTEKRDALLPTVISRGQMITLLPPDDDEIMLFLREKYPKKTDEELKIAADISGNIPGIAISSTDKLSSSERERAKSFIDLIFDKSTSAFSVYTFLIPVKSKRENVLSFLDSVIFYLKELLLVKCSDHRPTVPNDITGKNISQTSEKVILELCDYSVNLYSDIENNGNLTSCLTDYCSYIINKILRV